MTCSRQIVRKILVMLRETIEQEMSRKEDVVGESKRR